LLKKRNKIVYIPKDQTAHGNEKSHAETAARHPFQWGVVKMSKVSSSISAGFEVGVDMVEGDLGV
jgi:hypothetical protein